MIIYSYAIWLAIALIAPLMNEQETAWLSANYGEIVKYALMLSAGAMGYGRLKEKVTAQSKAIDSLQGDHKAHVESVNMHITPRAYDLIMHRFDNLESQLKELIDGSTHKRR